MRSLAAVKADQAGAVNAIAFVIENGGTRIK